jgi:hypothetical protein
MPDRPSSPKQSPGSTIDGIKSVATEQLAYHIHIGLTLYDHGKPVTVPTEIGIPGGEVQPRCYYWIHIHSATPHIIHVESPTRKAFTLGNFFDVWEATNSSAQPGGDAFIKRLRAAAAHKQVEVFVERQRWTGSYRSVPLLPNIGITIEIGKPTKPPKLYAS